MTAARMLAAGLGTGWAPRAPGTAGSLLGVLLGATLLAARPALLGLGVLLVIPLGLWSIRAATGLPWRGAKGADDDPSWVVIDEVAGQMLALLGLAKPSWMGVLVAFVLFRAFDIAKPGPIGWADRRGGVSGIMADDLLAGLAAAILVLIGRTILRELMTHDFP